MTGILQFTWHSAGLIFMRFSTFLLMAITTGSVRAELIEVDFLTPGDGLLIRDTVNNREWADPTKVVGMSVNQFFSSSIYAAHSFQFATDNDVEQLFLEAGADVISYGTDSQINTVGNLPAAQLLAGLMEHSSPFPQTSGNPWVYGYLDIASPTRVSLGRYYPGFPVAAPVVAQFGIDTWMTFGVIDPETWTASTIHPNIGVWAFRNTATVPEPSSIAALSVLCGAVWLKRRRPPSRGAR